MLILIVVNANLSLEMGYLSALHPVIPMIMCQDFYKELEQYYRNEGSKNIDSFRDFHMDSLENWKAQGKIREEIDEDLLPVLIQHFPKIIQYLAEFIMQGPTNHHK